MALGDGVHRAVRSAAPCKISVQNVLFGLTSGAFPGDASGSTSNAAHDAVLPGNRGNRRHHLRAGPRADLLVEYSYAPPITAVDSLVVDRATLAPKTEALRQQGRTVRLEYSPTSVDVTIQPDTGAAVGHARPLARPAFAFNQRELVIRSLPPREGLQAILRLFSEADEAVEMDTVSVVGDVPGATGHSAWRVRQSGRRMRYVPAAGSPPR